MAKKTDKRQPIVVSSKNDPRYIAYQDSLNVYDKAEDEKKYLSEHGFTEGDHVKKIPISEVRGYNDYGTKSVNPKSLFSKTLKPTYAYVDKSNSPDHPEYNYALFYEYKKPVQPYIVNNNIQQIPNSQYIQQQPQVGQINPMEVPQTGYDEYINASQFLNSVPTSKDFYTPKFKKGGNVNKNSPYRRDIIDSAFNKYPGMYSIGTPEQFNIIPATGVDKKSLNQMNRGLEYFPPQDNWYPLYDDPKQKRNLPYNGTHRTLVDTTGLSSKQLEDAVTLDFLSHGMHKNSAYNQFTNDLDKKLRQQYGDKMVDTNGKVDAYIRGYISNSPEYEPYKKELQFLPKGYFNILDSILKTKPQFKKGGSVSKWDTPQGIISNVPSTGKSAYKYGIPEPTHAFENVDIKKKYPKLEAIREAMNVYNYLPEGYKQAEEIYRQSVPQVYSPTVGEQIDMINPIRAGINLYEGQDYYGDWKQGTPVLNVAGDIASLIPFAKELNPIIDKAGKYATKTILKDIYKINPYAAKLNNPNAFYRIADEASLKDALESGVVRSKSSISNVNKEIKNLAERLNDRPTPFPSFAKGKPAFDYLPEEGTGYIYESKQPMLRRGDINPVTKQQIKGKHWAYRPFDLQTGKVLNNLPLDQVSIYSAEPHWLKGYREIKKPLMGESNIGSQGVPKIHTDLYPKDGRYYPTTVITDPNVTIYGQPEPLVYFNPQKPPSKDAIRYIEEPLKPAVLPEPRAKGKAAIPVEELKPKRTERLQDIRDRQKNEFKEYQKWFKKNRPGETLTYGGTINNNDMRQYKNGGSTQGHSGQFWDGTKWVSSKGYSGTYAGGVYFQNGGSVSIDVPMGQMQTMDNEYAINTMENGGIHIDPSKRGTFTAAATRHGKSVQGFASQVLANKDNYSPAMVKKANFAKNASKWKHEMGGVVAPDKFLYMSGGEINPYHPLAKFMCGGKVKYADGGKVQHNFFDGDGNTDNQNEFNGGASAPEGTFNQQTGQANYTPQFAHDPNKAGVVDPENPDGMHDNAWNDGMNDQQANANLNNRNQLQSAQTQQQSNNWGLAANVAGNLLGAGLMNASYFNDLKSKRNADLYQQRSGLSQNAIGVTNPVQSRGVYNQQGIAGIGTYGRQNVGYFQQPMGKYGGNMNQISSYAVGQQYEVDDNEIEKLKSLGYQFDII